LKAQFRNLSRHRAIFNDSIAKLPNYQILLNFFVPCVLAALLAILAEFQTAGRGLLVLGRRVIPIFAIGAL